MMKYFEVFYNFIRKLSIKSLWQYTKKYIIITAKIIYTTMYWSFWTPLVFYAIVSILAVVIAPIYLTIKVLLVIIYEDIISVHVVPIVEQVKSDFDAVANTVSKMFFDSIFHVIDFLRDNFHYKQSDEQNAFNKVQRQREGYVTSWFFTIFTWGAIYPVNTIGEGSLFMAELCSQQALKIEIEQILSGAPASDWQKFQLRFYASAGYGFDLFAYSMSIIIEKAIIPFCKELNHFTVFMFKGFVKLPGFWWALFKGVFIVWEEFLIAVCDLDVVFSRCWIDPVYRQGWQETITRFAESFWSDSAFRWEVWGKIYLSVSTTAKEVFEYLFARFFE